MAGIGFTLRKLSSRDDLTGISSAFVNAAFASCGNWIISIISLGLIAMLAKPLTASEELAAFNVVVVYNFALSLVLTSPVWMVAIRYLADRIHAEDISDFSNTLLTALALSWLLCAAGGVFLYFIVANINAYEATICIINLISLGWMWTIGVFLSAFKDYRNITLGYLAGMIIAISGVYLNKADSLMTLKMWFTLGIVTCVIWAVGFFYREFGMQDKPSQLLKYFTRYKEIALSGLFYNIAIWIDKWLMWHAPEAELSTIALPFYPAYDVAMFLACLSVIPAMALFMFVVETDFFIKYRRFYHGLLNHDSLKQINDNHDALVISLMRGARNIGVVAGAICIAAVSLSYGVYQYYNLDYTQLFMLRFGLIAALFHIFFLFTTIILYYFDLRQQVMWLNLLFMACCAVFTIITITLGFAYYGLGYLMAAIISFTAAFIYLIHYVSDLPYKAFSGR